MADIARRLGVAHPTVSKTIARLKREGLVDRATLSRHLPHRGRPRHGQERASATSPWWSTCCSRSARRARRPRRTPKASSIMCLRRRCTPSRRSCVNAPKLTGMSARDGALSAAAHGRPEPQSRAGTHRRGHIGKDDRGAVGERRRRCDQPPHFARDARLFVAGSAAMKLTDIARSTMTRSLARRAGNQNGAPSAARNLARERATATARFRGAARRPDGDRGSRSTPPPRRRGRRARSTPTRARRLASARARISTSARAARTSGTIARRRSHRPKRRRAAGVRRRRRAPRRPEGGDQLGAHRRDGLDSDNPRAGRAEQRRELAVPAPRSTATRPGARPSSSRSHSASAAG